MRKRHGGAAVQKLAPSRGALANATASWTAAALCRFLNTVIFNLVSPNSYPAAKGIFRGRWEMKPFDGRNPSAKRANMNNRGWRSEARATEPTDNPPPGHRPRRGRTNITRESSGWFAPFGDGDFLGSCPWVPSPRDSTHGYLYSPTSWTWSLRALPWRARERGSVLDCGSPLPLFEHRHFQPCPPNSYPAAKQCIFDLSLTNGLVRLASFRPPDHPMSSSAPSIHLHKLFCRSNHIFLSSVF
jgi:hypothetical protein